MQHLSPTHESSLADILSRATGMPVTEVQDEPQVEPNHVYVIPPDRDMTISGGALHLRPREQADGRHRAIDGFFSSLAADQGRNAIGIVLSGTANDGTQGLEIKGAGGITLVQDDTAEHRSMPRSAAAAGCADFVLPPDRIARELARIARHPYMAASPPAPDDEGGGKTRRRARGKDKDQGAEAGGPPLGEILQLLRGATGVDFTHYKINTLNRRIARRMVLHKMDEPRDYARLLRDNPGEVDVLYHDILIGVTGFFRDPENFEQLKETVFPRLLERADRRGPLRVWTLGCSTGQEAYSIAMAYTEFAEAAGSQTPAQIFATDVNAAVIGTARAGAYLENAVQDLSTERRRRFFTKVDGGHYSISKPIREMCVFARHNVLTDPPFSRMDLVSCRNLLIYLEPALQRKVMPLLHYALKPEGALMLGHSETIGTYRELFEVEDKRHKLYIRKPGPGHLPPGLADGSTSSDSGVPASAPSREAIPGRDPQKEADRVLLAKYAPAGVLIDADLEIRSFHGDTGPYVAPAPGKASLNLLKMVRRGLLVALRAAVHEARDTQAPVRKTGLRVELEDGDREVNLEVLPVNGAAAREALFWVLFEAPGAPDAPKQPAAKPKTRARAGAKNAQGPTEQQIARLTQDLDATRVYLQSTIEQHEAANEELQSANEEAQSANEELQTLNEELETSKEEIESSNEELATVNDGLNDRNRELNRLNNDLVNLFSSVQTPIIMVGQDLRIRRFTPAAQTQLNLHPADVGRPLGDIRLDLGIPDLGALLTKVIDTARIEAREVRDGQGRWHSLHLRPYKTLDNMIDGAVLMLLDVDALKRAQEYTESIVETVREPLLVLDGELRVRGASRSFYRDFEVAPKETQGRLLVELGNGQWNIPELIRLLKKILPQKHTIEDFEVSHKVGQIGVKTMRLNARQLTRPGGEGPLILLAIEDVTEQARLKETLQERVSELGEADRHRNEFLAMLAHELRNPLAALRSATEVPRMRGADGNSAERAWGIMDRQVQQMARMLDDLLDVSRITRGKIELRREPVELAVVIARAADATRHAMEAGNKELAVSLPAESIRLSADANRLEQVFDNLLNNAAKFTPPGGHIRLAAGRADSHAGGGGDVVVIRVRDDGIGISPEVLPHVFDLFAQGQTPLDRARGGLGLGLALVKNLVTLHGGSVEAHSAGAGRGSEFVVRLPILQTGETAAQEQPDTAGADAPPAASWW